MCSLEANTTARIDYEKMVGNPKTSLVGQLVLNRDYAD